MSEPRGIREVALRLVTVRPRSRRELETRLLSRGFAAEHVQAELDELERMGWLNDRQFAALWVNWRLANMPMGRARLAAELAAKGVDREIIRDSVEEAFSSVDERELAVLVARSRLRRESGEKRENVGRRLWSLLRRRGFSSEIATATVEAVLVTNASEVVDGEPETRYNQEGIT